MKPRQALHALAILVALAAPIPGWADRIRLQNGGEIRTEHWWLDGETLFYESPGGSVGIPMSLVLRIEPTVEASAPATDPGRPPAVPDHPRPSAALSADQPNELLEWMALGTEAFSRRDFESASSAFERAWNARRDLSAARVGYALSEIALGRDARALTCVLEGISLDPGNAELHEILGNLKDRDERVAEALDSWKEAFRLSPSDRVREKILHAGRELAAASEYTFSAAPHFNVRFDDGMDRALAEAITEFLEAAYRDMARLYHHAPPQAITVLLYPERAFRDVTQTGDDIAGIFDGKIRVPLGGLDRLDEGARRLLRHELTHAFLQSKTRGNCPRWLHEGLAQRAEGRSLTATDRAAVRKLLARSDPAAWDSAGFSYPAALSLTLYLHSLRGEAGVFELLDRLAEGDRADEGLRLVYGAGYDDLCRDWADSLLKGEVKR